jgi:tRNA (cytidine/uridine-2'-O-)-methyltransferase
MFNCVLYEPEIPPNTGNIIRLCANSNIKLHLIHPLGFYLDAKNVRRAGLDYHDLANVKEHKNYKDFIKNIKNQRIFACSTHGKTCYTTPNYQVDDIFLFGPETRGLPKNILAELPPEQVIRIPMHANNRSLNLSNSVAIILYEAWRQHNFKKTS